ncbi:AAA family ATPase [Leptolyngbya sp. NK1-12]|uniref:AAA family ATPase n=1 Tax=Leptolyngbya sp. NK1-12 TaxID=2547451 RepID=A0AA96WN66_9CYAN|nr:AAA family ATPase [Leptolyngbya sp. NK1-12]
MSVIALVNQKGGCAKSTTAVHLAYWLLHKQRNVLLVDADAQRSSSIWLESLEDTIACEVIQSPDLLLERIPQLAQQYDELIVDGPAGLSDATQSIVLCADLAVIPCQPSGVDLRSAADAVQLIRQAQANRNGAPLAAVFLSRAVKGTRLKEEAMGHLESLGVPILKTVIHQRQAIADTFGQTATVWELLGKASVEAAEEFEQLFQEIMALLEPA